MMTVDYAKHCTSCRFKQHHHPGCFPCNSCLEYTERVNSTVPLYYQQKLSFSQKNGDLDDGVVWLMNNEEKPQSQNDTKDWWLR